MLKKIGNESKNQILNLVMNDIFQNPYLYIDINAYGLDWDKKILTWVLNREDDIISIIYKYYNSLQIFNCKENNEEELLLISKFISDNNFNMISGEIEVISKIGKYLSKYKLTSGYIMSSKIRDASNNEQVIRAKIGNCCDIARLICSDDNIGSHYKIDDLAAQIQDRMVNRGCRNYIVLKNNSVLCHAGTYAELDDIAIIGGVVTNELFRKKGLASVVLKELTSSLLLENKSPILYCYDQSILQWYQKLGWDIVRSCAKLELKIN